MNNPITLFTGQWADMPLEELAPKAASWGYQGLELACWGDHFDVYKAVHEKGYCEVKHALLKKHKLQCFAISNHLVGQAVCDRIDARHQAIVPERVWGDGSPEDVKKRAAEEMILTAKAAEKMGVSVVNGFTGSSIWHLLYSFPPVLPGQIDAGFQDFADRWNPILDAFDTYGIRFALEVHPSEIAFDIVTAEKALTYLKHRKTFGFNFDPSHFGYQGVDYLRFIDTFPDRIFHVHFKDVTWTDHPGVSGVFGGHLTFGHPHRHWNFRSIGHGKIQFNEIIRRLQHLNYQGPFSIEWEDSDMNREFGAQQACQNVQNMLYQSSHQAFDEAFQKSFQEKNKKKEIRS